VQRRCWVLANMRARQQLRIESAIGSPFGLL
jgi:hypothetical protein